jgi:hypothetical protein
MLLSPILKTRARAGFAGRSTLVLLALGGPALAQYSGPAILSRGEAPSAMSAPTIRFQPYVSLDANYDTALSNVALNEDGQIAHEAALGVRVGWGISGAHRWAHTRIGLSYHGTMLHYPKSSTFDSMNHSLLLGINHQLSRKVSLVLNESAGMFSRDLGLLGLPQSVPFDPSTTFIPATDYFDNRTYYLGSTADLVIQQTARLSFDLGGSAFLTRRRSRALDGSLIETARGDVQYRLTRRATIGAVYNFTTFQFNQSRGDTTVHMFGPSFSVRVNRWLELTGMVGAARVESKFLNSAPVDPAIAALLGITSTQQIVHRVDYLNVPTFSARLSRAFRTGVIYAYGGHAVTPGNGLFETSFAYSVAGGYNYTGLRRWSINAQVMYTDAQSIGSISGNYTSETATVSVARKIVGDLHMNMRYSARQYGSSTYAGYNRFVNGASVGLTWAPGDVPVRLW